MGLFDAIGSVIGTITANKVAKYQMSEGERMLQQALALQNAYQRPQMFVPEAIQAMTRLAQGRMYQQMPGMTYFENQLKQATASGLSAAQQMSAGPESLGMIARLYGSQMQGLQNLAGQQAQYQANAQNTYLNALQNLGQWQQQAWQWNAADPYLQAMQKSAQLEQVGYLNKFAGLSDLYGNRANMWKGIFSSLDEMLGGGSGFANVASAILPLL